MSEPQLAGQCCRAIEWIPQNQPYRGKIQIDVGSALSRSRTEVVVWELTMVLIRGRLCRTYLQENQEGREGWGIFRKEN